MAEDARHRGHIRAARDHQTGGGVPEGMDVQLLRQAVLLEDQLEAVGEGGGRHGELRSLTAEQEVISGQLPLVIGFGDVCTFLPVLPQETFHLGGEVHIAVTCAGLGFFYEDLLVRHLDRVAADVDGTLLPINVAPLQSAALAPPHSRGDDELEVGFVLDALALQRGDDLLRRFLVRDLLFTLAPGVAVGAPRRIIQALKSEGVRKMVMLTGDAKKVADSVASALGLDEVYSELLPADRVEKVEQLIQNKPEKGKLAFVGDGINDAPVLRRADIGIAMGAMGSDAAIEAADVVLMDDDPLQISKAIKISRKCLGIVYQNIVVAIGVKLACLVLVALGFANMWLAVFADVGVMIIAVLNAIRALFVKNL